jgi:hypothetical protein
MNEKIRKGCQKMFLAGGVVLAVVLFSLGTVGCATRPIVVATDESIIAGQISTARIEAINGEVNRILHQYDLLIERAQLGAIRGIDDALEALDRYDEFVQQCIRSLREIEHRTRTGTPGEAVLVSSLFDRLPSLPAELDRQGDHVHSLDQEGSRAQVARHPDMTKLARETARRVNEWMAVHGIYGRTIERQLAEQRDSPGGE